MKQLLRKADDPYLALLEYRNTPVTGLKYSPVQILNSRQLRSKLPVSDKLLQPGVMPDVRPRLVELQNTQKFYHDQRAKPLSQLLPRESVRYRDGGKWKPAVVSSVHDAPRSYLIDTEGGRQLRRNRCHLQKTLEPPHILPHTEDNAQVPAEVPVQSDNSSLTVPDARGPVRQSNQNIQITRSGRLVKPPNKLNL